MKVHNRRGALVVTLVIVVLSLPARAAASFPGGTVVATTTGEVSIEELRAGSSIRSLDATANAASEVWSRYYVGELVSFVAGGRTVRSTPGHPFRVVSGSGLAGRPPAGSGSSLGKGLSPGSGRWVAARDLVRGDRLLAAGGAVEVTSVSRYAYTGSVYDVRSTLGVVLVGGDIVAGDVSLDEPSGADAGVTPGGSGDGLAGDGGACFPAGTLVHTPQGPVPIELLSPGALLWSWDSSDRAWVLREIDRRFVHEYNGELIRVTAGGEEVVATANHPFWAEQSGQAAMLPVVYRAGTPPAGRTAAHGRWVTAGDLKPGDRLVTRGGTAVVTGISRYAGELSVYNLSVPGTNTYAVGPGGIVVHNKGRAERSSSSGAAAAEEDRDRTTAPPTTEPLTEVSPAPGVRPDTGTADATPGTTAPPSVVGALRQSASGLSAGYADDNAEFGAYLGFLERFGQSVPHIPFPVSERIVLRILDADGRSVPNAAVTVSAGGELLASGKSHADGRFLFFPREHGERQSYSVEIASAGQRERIVVEREGHREITVRLPRRRQPFQAVPLDVLFVLDTTGSMGEEISRLTQSIEIIHLNLTSLSSRPAVRFGMVLYKDRGDEYTTRTVPLTPDVESFRAELRTVGASGGGDYPEDLQAALAASMRQIDWNPDGIRLVFIITDAPPQLYPDQSYTYRDAARDARAAGIKFYTVGTGGMDVQGEYPLRQLSQYTGARYIFLTYGEQGESEGGAPGSVSHHTGANYQTDKLEAVIIRFAKEELQHLTDLPVEDAEPYFTANPVAAEGREETLQKLFAAALEQLLAYSTWAIPGDTPTAIVPFHAADASLGVASEYLAEQLLFTMRRGELPLTLVERREMQAILEEIEFQLSGIVAEESVTRVGELAGAKLLITGSVFHAENDYELFLRLLRVATGEVLAVTRTQIAGALLP